MGTVEAALALAALVVVAVLCLSGVTAIISAARCTDAAREAARLAALGDGAAATATALSVAPSGAEVHLRRDGGFVIATVTARHALLPGIPIRAHAVSAVEPSMSR
ncbi:TadE family type IV pilus minor pilin [Mycobacterium sp. ACS4331]|uniref:TadE family type IV pilus minor pilin n=1 Tax=Mycobacterium sp. ACS4331 TaxID=1834121 RepID=UPI0007FD30A4|nr:TadE family type IV pilus minor pilin [Mycobacterium sp. ACS4331]OBF23307.1 hypothetical protein A5727_06835 [Mycobacterium sp. ACS4331]